MKISKILCMLILMGSALSVVQAKGSNKYESLKNKECEHFIIGEGEVEVEVVLVCKGEARNAKLKSKINKRGRKNSLQDVVDFIGGSETATVNTRTYGTCSPVVHTETYSWSEPDYSCEMAAQEAAMEAEMAAQESYMNNSYGDMYTGMDDTDEGTDNEIDEEYPDYAYDCPSGSMDYPCDDGSMI